MGRESTGGVYSSRGKLYARVTIGPKNRPAVLVPETDEAQARERSRWLNDLAASLRAAKRTEYAEKVLEQGAVLPRERWHELAKLVEGICAGRERPKAKPATVTLTFAKLREQWTSGELAKLYPHHVHVTRSAGDDAGWGMRWIEPVCGPLPVASVTIEHFEEVMRRAHAGNLADASILHVAQVMRRVLDFAVYPLKLIAVNPIPKTAMPKVRRQKQGRWLYPSEDAKLLACKEVDLGRRLLYGFLTRLGWRKGEAIGGALTKGTKVRHVPPLSWGAVDLKNGVVNLDKNKTDEPRVVPLGADVVRALEAWKKVYPGGEPADDAPVFVQATGATHNRGSLADVMRTDMQDVAKLDRAELFTETDTHHAITVHCLRASFVTISLAEGRSEKWICDRTGHRSHGMVLRYARPARTFKETHKGSLAPLDAAIPEFAAVSNGGETAADSKGKGDSQTIPSGSPQVRRPRHTDEASALPRVES